MEDRAFGALPGLIINQVSREKGQSELEDIQIGALWLTGPPPPPSQTSGLSPKTTVEKSKALIDSVHEFKKAELTPKPIAIGMDRLDVRVHTLGGMVTYHRG